MTEEKEKYKNFFYDTNNLENVYNLLKEDDKELKKETIKNLIEEYEGVEYQDISDDTKNEINNSEEGIMLWLCNILLGTKDVSESISFDEFCNIFHNIYDKGANNPEKLFMEGFAYMDKNQ